MRYFALALILLFAGKASAQMPVAANDAGYAVRTDGVSLWAVEAYLFDRVNQARTKAGLQPLVCDEALTIDARQHTCEMCQARSMYHSGHGAENVAYGTANAETMFQMWMNSPGHRANILGNYTRYGGAIYQSPGEQIYGTQRFR